MLAYKQMHDTPVTIYCCMYSNCGSEYATKFNLKRHVESVHMKIKKFKCQVCETLFSSKQSLKEHFHIHMGSMPFKCVTCDKTFRQASQLSLHKRIHAMKGTPSVVIKSTAEDFVNFKCIKIESEVSNKITELPGISEERKNAVLLPFPRMCGELERTNSPNL